MEEGGAARLRPIIAVASGQASRSKENGLYDNEFLPCGNLER